MTLVLLAMVAHGGPTAELESVVQVRPDLYGDRMAPSWQYASFQHSFGQMSVRGYAGLEWIAGLDNKVDPDLYSLELRSSTSWGSWSVGRQNATSALRPQIFDGGRVAWRLSDAFSVEAWAGFARNQDLNDLVDGIGMGRVQARYADRRGAMVVGLQIESGKDHPFIARQDVQARWRVGSSAARPSIGGRLVVAEASPTVEWARVEGGAWVSPTLEAKVWVQHRDSANPTALLGDAILYTFADGAMQEAGVGARLVGKRWSMVRVDYGLSTYTWSEDARQWGHSLDVAWSPGRGESELRLVPSYMFRSGPGGTFHATSLRAETFAGERLRASIRGAVVPFRKGRGRWRTAMNVGGELERRFDWMRVMATTEIATDSTLQLDVRGGAVITMEVR